ncbi:nucleotidyltransferase domain-containing protein [Natronospora cellulosivora (SeqCode)]
MTNKKIKLASNQQLAIDSLKKELMQRNFSIEEYIMFGSVARGEAEEGSDLDILALTSQSISHRLKHDIYGIVTEINLKFDTNLSILLIDKNSWDSGIYSILPIKDEVKEDGVRL